MGENVCPTAPVPRHEGIGKDLKMRVTPTRLVPAALTVGCVTLALYAAPAGASASAKQIVQSAISATESAKSLTIAGAVVQGKQTISLNVSASTSGVGQGTIGIGTGTATVRLVGGTVYFMGDASFWTKESGKSAAQLFAGKWVSTAATTTNGQELSAFLNSGAFLRQLFGSNLTKATFTNAGTAKVAGKSVIVIAGRDKSNSGGRLYVAASGKPYVLKISISSPTESGGLVFSNYNRPITPVIPSGAINLDTLSS